MKNKEKKLTWNYLLNNFEAELATVMFCFLTVFLTIQVISRYVFNNSAAWAEELSTILFVWMIYFGVASAVTKRKHLRIDYILTIVPFKVRKVLMILDDIVFAAFSVYLIFPITEVIHRFRSAKSSLLGIPKKLIYFIIPAMMVLTLIRLIQDIVRLIKENENELGVSEPALDIDSLEREFLESRTTEAQREGEQ